MIIKEGWHSRSSGTQRFFRRSRNFSQTVASANELAAGNERMARQAAQFRDDLRRLGTRQATPARDVLRRPEADTSRSTAPSTGGKTAAIANGSNGTPGATASRPSLTARAREMQRALQGHFGAEPQEAPPAPAPQSAPIDQLSQVTMPVAVDVAQAQDEPSTKAVAASAPLADQPQRARLLERLKGYEQA